MTTDKGDLLDLELLRLNSHHRVYYCLRFSEIYYLTNAEELIKQHKQRRGMPNTTSAQNITVAVDTTVNQIWAPAKWCVSWDKERAVDLGHQSDAFVHFGPAKSYGPWARAAVQGGQQLQQLTLYVSSSSSIFDATSLHFIVLLDYGWITSSSNSPFSWDKVVFSLCNE